MEAAQWVASGAGQRIAGRPDSSGGHARGGSRWRANLHIRREALPRKPDANGGGGGGELLLQWSAAEQSAAASPLALIASRPSMPPLAGLGGGVNARPNPPAGRPISGATLPPQLEQSGGGRRATIAKPAEAPRLGSARLALPRPASPSLQFGGQRRAQA